MPRCIQRVLHNTLLPVDYLHHAGNILLPLEVKAVDKDEWLSYPLPAYISMHRKHPGVQSYTTPLKDNNTYPAQAS